MRYSQVNHWYKVEEVLGGLEGTRSADVQVELLRHLGRQHISSFEVEHRELIVTVPEQEPIRWHFRSEDVARRFMDVVAEWFKAQHVTVPACK